MSVLTGTVAAVADAVTTGGFRAGWSLVRWLPERTAYTTFEAAADLVHARNGAGVRRLRSNYRRVRPDVSTVDLEILVRDGVRSYLRYWCDAFRLPDLSPTQILERVRIIGDDAIRAHLAAGRPVVAFLGHLGNWDMAGAWGTLHLGPVVTVAERLKPEEVYAEFLAFRESLGMKIFPLTGGGNVIGELRRALREPIILPLLADRDLTAHGIPVTMLGHEVSVAAGPAALAVSTGAPLHPVSIWYERATDLRSGWRTVIHFHDQVADPGGRDKQARVAAMTQACATVLGDAIDEHLVDWHMMQRVFTADLEPRAKVGP